MGQILDQSPNIELVVSELRKQLGGDWEVASLWRFENLTVDVIASHPGRGLAIFRVATLPDEFLFSDLPRPELQKNESKRTADSNAGDFLAKFGLVGNPREQIEFWRDQVQQMLEPTAPKEFKQFLFFGLVIFQRGSNGQTNIGYMKAQTHNVKDVRIRTELVRDAESLVEIAKRLIPSNDASTESRMPSELWKKIQTAILGDPSLIIEQLPPPMNDFDSDQLRFIKRVASERFSRLQGPAGSGKTTVVARLAADAVLRGERVLVVSRNKSICPMIKARVQRYVIESAKEKAEQYALIRRTESCATIVHQEIWWKLVFAQSGYLKESNLTYASSINDRGRKGSDKDDKETELSQLKLLVKAVQRLKRFSNESVLFDLVIVDEAQNMLVENWTAMKMMLRSDQSRAVIVADRSQSLYGDRPWTDTRMQGFSGPWSRLSRSHRFPRNFFTLIHDFVKQFPPGEDVVLPEIASQDELFPDDAYIWFVETKNKQAGWQADLIARCVIYMRDVEMYQPYEIAFLVASNERGFNVVKKLLDFDPKFETSTTFNEERRLEFGLGLGVRGSTVHSYAGWESPCLIIDLDVPSILGNPNALIYSAITRLRKRMAGSALVFICGDDSYSNFFRRHSKQLIV
ncbi:MAG: hypothetical protein EBX92_03435 [Actinobacteria bacterium]|nr:hypothetical protein [Actinomycetota bacterium]